MLPFWAVPTIVMVFVPTFSGMLDDGWPEVTAALFTVTVALASAIVGVTVMLLVAFGTLSVSVVGTVWPCDSPPLVASEYRVLFGDRATFTTTV